MITITNQGTNAATITQVDLTDDAARLLGIATAQPGVDIGDVTVNNADTNPVNVGSAGITITQTPTIDTAIYASGDNVGGLLTFANAARLAGGGGVIKSLVIVDDGLQSASLELWLFNQTFTQGADQAAWTPVAADLHNLVAVLRTGDGVYFTGGATATVCVVEVSHRYDLLGTSLYGRLVVRGTPTYPAATNLTVILGLLQD